MILLYVQNILYRVRTLFGTKNSRTFQVLSRTHSHFSRTPFSAKKSLESMSVLVCSHHKQFYPEGLSVFAPFLLQFSLNYKVSTEIQGLSGTNSNFQDFFQDF